MLEPLPQYGNFNEQDGGERDQLLPRPARFGGEDFPGNEPALNNAPARSRSANVQLGAGNGQSSGVDVIAAVGERESEFLIEDTSASARRVKGGINRINYWAINCNRCWSGNGREVGHPLRTVFCGGGGTGSLYGDVAMFIIYVWFTVILPVFGAAACVQFAFEFCNSCAWVEWMLLLTTVWAFLSVVYMLYALRHNYNVFNKTFFFIEVSRADIPGHINYFLKLTMSNIHRFQVLERRQRDLLTKHLEQRQDASLHIMLYTNFFVEYVYTRPRNQMICSLVVLLVSLAGHCVGLYYRWDDFGFDLHL